MQQHDPRLMSHLIALGWLLDERCPVSPPELPALPGLKRAHEAASQRYEAALDRKTASFMAETTKHWLRVWNQCSVGDRTAHFSVFLARVLEVLDEAIGGLRAAHQERAKRGKPVSADGQRRLCELVALNEALRQYDGELERLVGSRLSVLAAESAEEMGKLLQAHPVHQHRGP